ncbi:MAG: hypothetical protein QXD43_00575 [Candidatus Aenigmatarchaeota archaeon]
MDLHDEIKNSNLPVIKENINKGFLTAYQNNEEFRKAYKWLYHCAEGGCERGE